MHQSSDLDCLAHVDDGACLEMAEGLNGVQAGVGGGKHRGA